MHTEIYNGTYSVVRDDGSRWVPDDYGRALLSFASDPRGRAIELCRSNKMGEDVAEKPLGVHGDGVSKVGGGQGTTKVEKPATSLPIKPAPLHPTEWYILAQLAVCPGTFLYQPALLPQCYWTTSTCHGKIPEWDCINIEGKVVDALKSRQLIVATHTVTVFKRGRVTTMLGLPDQLPPGFEWLDLLRVQAQLGGT